MRAPDSRKSRICAVSIALLLVSACSSNGTSEQATVTSTTIDPYTTITTEVDQFVRSYVNQAVASRPELIRTISQPDLIACVTSAVQQIARSAATSIEKTSTEEESSWYARSRTAALQSTQSGIEAVIATCAR